MGDAFQHSPGEADIAHLQEVLSIQPRLDLAAQPDLVLSLQQPIPSDGHQVVADDVVAEWHEPRVRRTRIGRSLSRSRSTAPPGNSARRAGRSIRAVLARTADDLRLAGIAGRQKLQEPRHLAGELKIEGLRRSGRRPRDLVEIGKMILSEGVFHRLLGVEDDEPRLLARLATKDASQPLDHLTAAAVGGQDDAQIGLRHVDALVQHPWR
ncbi:hypothetical protein SDC9_107324 [bioreactor metagenome]|uniref:Uncharacterized protein n=1 Tax=bioreactor metagenome TaxID=1076179 RepID=A0A645BBC1_9ZZZZ